MKDILYTGKYDKDNSGYDASWREPYWKKLHEEAGGDEEADKIVEALKLMYTMYTDDLVKWYANLYDPGMGAYYCTTSGKENEGFLPDIESTYQALHFLIFSGMLDEQGGSYTKVMSNEMKERLVRFIKGMQLPNGYFYNYLKTQERLDHPTGVPKRGRDLGWCTDLLRKLGAYPTYDTPNGMLGDGIDKNGNPVSDFRRLEVSGGEEKKPTGAALNYPAYLENRETMIAYLNENVPIVEHTYPAGNHLNATYPEYMARDKAMGWLGTDKSLTAGLIEWLNEKINPKTGYWTGEVNFNGTNGFFKVIVIYNSWGIPYPAIEKAIDSVLEVILGDEPSTGNICAVYNIWSALISAKYNVINCYPASEREALLAKINKTMKERGPEAILNTYKKQSGYQKPDGAFAHEVTRGNRPEEIIHHQGGIPTGLRLEEGDVDAIGKATNGIVLSIFNAYGFTPVPIYHDREWQLYKSIIENAKPVVKKNTAVYR